MLAIGSYGLKGWIVTETGTILTFRWPFRPRRTLGRRIGTRDVEQATIARLGALQSLTFSRVGPAGPSIYQATFEKGALEWRIRLNPDGSVDVFFFRAVSPPK